MTDLFRITRISDPAIAVYPPGATFGPRDLTDYELVWLMEGNCHYILNGDSIVAPEGSFVLCRPGSTDAFIWDIKRRTRHGYCHFSLDTISPNFSPPSTWPTIKQSSEAAILEPAFQYLLSVGSSRDRSAVEIAISLLLVAFVSVQQRGAPAEAVLPEAVERVLGYVMERLDSEPDAKVTLTDMAAVAFCTKEHLCRVFSAALNITPAECVRLAKLDRAATMLARSNYSISEIALLYGFSNPSHFTKRFMEEYDMPPREFRQFVRHGGKVPPTRLLR